MKLSSLILVVTLPFILALTPPYQIDFSNELVNAILQVPMVVGLIYLVLKLEDKRQASASLREETFRKIVNDLLGVIIELSTLANPNTITSSQIKSIESYLKSQKEQGK